MEKLKGEKQLNQLLQWFDRGEAVALMGAYEDHHETGTTGIGKPHAAAVIDARGVLYPERFQEYMLKLHSRLIGTMSGFEERRLEASPDMRFLKDTLCQMLGSVEFGDKEQPGTGFTLHVLFEHGREMGLVLDEYFKEIGAERRPTFGVRNR
jgi:hypothetical protein